MKKLLHIVLVGSLSLLCFSCYYDELPEEIDTITEIPEEQEVSFSQDIQPIFSKCTQCHDGNQANPDLREGNAYNAVVPDYVTAEDGENSELFLKSPGNNHPVDVGFILSADELALIKTWIDRGAENN
jgi:hypothetical protein